MHFAAPIPWWAVGLVAAAIAAVAFWSYRRPLAPLSGAQRWTLTALRALALGLVALFLCRPVILLPPVADRDLVVPVLVDVSRSMRIADADGATRLARAAAIFEQDIAPSLAGAFTPEVYAVGDSWTAAQPADFRSDGRRSNLAEAVDAIRERYRGRRVPGIVLISDGATTGSAEAHAEGAPLFTIGVGSADGPSDREVVGLSAGDPRIDQTSIDLRVSTVSRGYGRSPFQLRILANGRLLESRTVTPAAEWIARRAGDHGLARSGRRDGLHRRDRAGRRRSRRREQQRDRCWSARLAGSAGCWRSRERPATSSASCRAPSPGIQASSSIRSCERARTRAGSTPSSCRRAAGRAAALTSGFPASREALYGYDALIVVNVEGDFFPRAQLTMAAEFVSVRGGGLVVLGGRSFAQRGLLGTPLEEALPVELNDRRGGLARAADGRGGSAQRERRHADPGRRIASGDANRPDRGRDAQALGCAAAPCRERRGWRPPAGRHGPGGDDGRERCAVSGRRRAALRAGPLDGIRGRGVMALAHAGPRRRSHLRALLASGGAMARDAGSRPRLDRRSGCGRTGRSGADRG